MVDQQQIQQWIIELRSEDYLVRAIAADNLAEYGDETVIRHLLREFNPRDYKEYGRLEPIEIIAQRLGPVSIKPLIDYLLEMDIRGTHFPIYTLENGLVVNGSAAVEPVIELLHRSDYLRTCAIRVLSRIKDVRAIRPLMEVVELHKSYEVIETLALFGEEGITALLELWKSENQTVRFRVMYVIRQLKSKQHHAQLLTMLIEALQDSYWLVKMNAIEALGHFGNEQTVDLLIPFLSDQAYQHPAANALEKIGTAKALQAVQEWKLTKSQKS